MRNWRVWKWAKAHPFTVDVALAAAVAVVALFVHFHQRSYDEVVYHDPNAATIALVIAAWSRSRGAGRHRSPSSW